MKKPTYFLIFLIIPLVSIAQDKFEDLQISLLKSHVTLEQMIFIDKLKMPEAVKLPALTFAVYYGAKREERVEYHSNWDMFLKKYFGGFFTETKIYESFQKRVALGYGILGMGNFQDGITRGYKYSCDDEKLAQENKNSIEKVQKLINDTVWVENTFTALMPIYKKAWAITDDKTKSIMTEIVYYADSCVNNFNYNKERNYYNDLFAARCLRCFIHEVGNPYRKIDAFIYRRLHNARYRLSNWNLTWMKKMMVILKNELKIVIL